MKIKDFLSASDVALDVRASDKVALLKELAGRAASALGLSADAVASEIEKRDELGSTGIGGGVSIPHARFREVKKPFGLLVRLKHANRIRCHRRPAGGPRVPAPAASVLPARPAQCARRCRTQAEGS